MTEPVVVDDPADPRLVDYVDLADPDVRRRVEARDGFFIAESPLVVRRLLDSGRRVRSVLVTPRQFEAMRDDLSARLDPAVPVFVAPEAVLRRVVGFDLHRGAVAAADRWPLPSLGDRARGRAAGRGARAGQRPREPGRAVPQRGRARGRRGAARRRELRSALPAVRAGVDRPRACCCPGRGSSRSKRCAAQGSRRSR